MGGAYIFLTNSSWQFSDGYKYYSLLANKLIFSVSHHFPHISHSKQGGVFGLNGDTGKL